MQLIYRRKTQRILPEVKFPDSFSLSANEKHFSKMQESLMLIVEIVTPYVEKEREILDLGDNNIKLTKVPANMTNHFKPLDLTVNCSWKAFLKKKFTEW